MILKAMVLALDSTALHANSACYLVEELKGYSVRAGHEFSDAGPFDISPDGLTGQKFMVEFDGKNSSDSAGGGDAANGVGIFTVAFAVLGYYLAS